ncbi:MAG: nicotinate-nucleotide adenylyltransferase [Nitrospiria bacterium]
MKRQRIGLLGGTFNPIHMGHLHAAREVLNAFQLDFVLFILAGSPPHKENAEILSVHHRLEMVRLALSETPQFQLCDLETTRSGPSFTIDTVEALQQRYPKDLLFFIVGMDAFTQFHTWKSPERLLTLCDFVIIARPGHPFSKVPGIDTLRTIDRTALHDLDHGFKKLYRFATSDQTALHFISIPISPISATEIRRGLESDPTTRKRLPQSVESYIIKHKIYKEDGHF